MHILKTLAASAVLAAVPGLAMAHCDRCAPPQQVEKRVIGVTHKTVERTVQHFVLYPQADRIPGPSVVTTPVDYPCPTARGCGGRGGHELSLHEVDVVYYTDSYYAPGGTLGHAIDSRDPRWGGFERRGPQPRAWYGAPGAQYHADPETGGYPGVGNPYYRRGW